MSTLTCQCCRIRTTDQEGKDLCDICENKKKIEDLERRIKNLESQLGTTMVLVEAELENSEDTIESYTLGPEDFIED